MMKHKFVEFIPKQKEDGILYISLEYSTVVHKCACGCGLDVITPISPHDWKIIYNGETITLHPSIGNWSYKCRSHYWIKNNNVVWANDFSDEQIKATREADRHLKNKYFSEKQKVKTSKEIKEENFLSKLIRRIKGLF
ncbi:DUF6527 family protein [Aliarcobacter skirrowii]|uniref:DUF6527 family protein n=2 Tax=Arcobacteraceae TaxID=2808963 RepID=A0AAW9DCL5_9BACT|nr:MULTISPECIES: DUF6527 family protein [Arcobacteraceae]MDX4069876.1 DUF6527 family protein [Aliarcobacter skirrowii]